MQRINKRKTIICDIDGTILFHPGNKDGIVSNKNPILLNNVKEVFNHWIKKDYFIILTTARKESERDDTRKQLEKVGIVYDCLIMGCGSGERILINDAPATAIQLKRNSGFDLNLLNV